MLLKDWKSTASNNTIYTRLDIYLSRKISELCIGCFLELGFCFDASVVSSNFVLERRCLPSAFLDLTLYFHDRYKYNAAMLEKGLVQIYTGDGKGKTTAAFGAALRAAGQGNKVLIYQFLKPASLDIGERFAIQLGAVRIRVETLDVPWDMSESLGDEKAVTKIQAAISDALKRITQTAEKRFYDVLILDEIVFCLSEGLAKFEDIKDLIDRRDSAVEIILTGRGATAELIELADLVTEMKNIKHPFDKGLLARRGIEY